MIKTTGYEFKKFFTDESYWFANGNKNTYYDESEILINHVDFDSYESVNDICDNDIVKINGGYVMFDDDSDMPFEKFFKIWKNKQATRSFIVECNIEKYDDVATAIKSSGGKII